MEEIQEGICGTHQSAPKMKWSLRLFKEYVMSYSIMVFADCNDNLINRTNMYTKMCKTCLKRYYEKRTNKIRRETESKQ